MSERRVRRGGGGLQGFSAQTLVVERNECVLDVLERTHDCVLVSEHRLVLVTAGDLVDRARPSPVEDRHRQQAGNVGEARGPKVEPVHLSVLATEQCADKQPWEPLRRGLPTSKVGRFQLRPRCEQIGAAFEELGRLSWLDVRNGRGAGPRLHHRRIGGLTPDQHGDSVSRGSGERLERRYRCARARRVRAGAFDIEVGREPHTLPGGYEAKRLVLGSRDRAYRFELLECANEREVVGRHITQYQQAHTPCLVFSRHFVCRGSSCTCSQSSAEVDFPRNAESATRCLHIRNGLLCTAGVIGALITAATDRTEAGQQPGPADGLAGTCGPHALRCNFDVAVFARGTANQIGQAQGPRRFPTRPPPTQSLSQLQQQTDPAQRQSTPAWALRIPPGRARATQRGSPRSHP